MRTRALALAMVVLLALAADASAESDPHAGGAVVDGTPTVVVSDSSSGGGGTSRPGSGGVVCHYFDAPVNASEGVPAFPGSGVQVASLVEGQLYWRLCFNALGEQVSYRLFIFEPNAPPMSGAELAVLARAEVILQFPEPQANPPVDAEQLVGVKTWLWLDRAAWQPASATATVPGISATVTATPVATEWAMGDGETEHCDGPGTPYTDGARTTDCGHLYSVASTNQAGGLYDAAVTVVWQVRWTATDGTGGDLGTLRRTTPFQLQVGERQASIR